VIIKLEGVRFVGCFVMRRELLVVLAVCVAFALVLGYELISSISFPPAVSLVAANATPPCPTLGAVACPACPTAVPETVQKMELRLPAVDRQKQGALANLTVESVAGNGRVFVRMDSNSPLMNTETQDSLRRALEAARRASGMNAGDRNLFYSISAPSDVVGGKSAGAAMAIATMALLRGEELRGDAVITGTIEENGGIGQVGEIVAKARAVKAAGYSLFLVPSGEATESKSVEKCDKTRETIEGGVVIREVCRTVEEAVNVSTETGIQVAEVKNLADAYQLMKK